METNTDTVRVSAVKNVEAPDGSNFDILRNAPEGAAQTRGQALVDMRNIVEQREPSLSSYLRTGSGTSAEYAMSSAISHSQDKGVKADLTRVRVKASLAEGHRSSAVRDLAYAKAAELDLPEYSEQSVANWYAKDVEEGNWHDAWFLATGVLTEGNKALKEVNIPEWKDRESQSFTNFAEDVLTRLKEAPSTEVYDWELDVLFNECRFRDDGYQAETPSELSQRIAMAKVQEYMGHPKREWMALHDAIEAKLPDEYIKELKWKMSAVGKAVEKVKTLANRIQTKISTLFGGGTK